MRELITIIFEVPIWIFQDFCIEVCNKNNIKTDEFDFNMFGLIGTVLYLIIIVGIGNKLFNI